MWLSAPTQAGDLGPWAASLPSLQCCPWGPGAGGGHRASRAPLAPGVGFVASFECPAFILEGWIYRWKPPYIMQCQTGWVMLFAEKVGSLVVKDQCHFFEACERGDSRLKR